MTPWAASIARNGAGLRVRFARPVKELELTADCARRFAASLLIAAEGVDDGGHGLVDFDPSETPFRPSCRLESVGTVSNHTDDTPSCNHDGSSCGAHPCDWEPLDPTDPQARTIPGPERP